METTPELRTQSEGGYRYLPSTGPVPFCGAVAPEPGFEIVHAVLERPLPWRDGFAAVEKHLAGRGRPRQALCAVELRCAQQYTPEGFREFNAGYAELLAGWGLFSDGIGATARTNVHPEVSPPSEQAMYAFAYTEPASDERPTFILSGAPERIEVREATGSDDGLKAMAADVFATLDQRLRAVGQSWEAVTEFAVYTLHDLWPALQSEVLTQLGAAALHGVHWYPSRPPVIGAEIELDARAVWRQLRVPTR